MTQDLAELSIRLGYEERAYMARWLALEVLMTDELVQEDQDLYTALARFQDAQEQDVRQKHGLEPGPRPRSGTMSALPQTQTGSDGSQP